MSRSSHLPDLKRYMEKKIKIKLNADRGFDHFMNLVVDNTVEVNGNENNEIGTVVIRGTTSNSQNVSVEKKKRARN